MPESAGRFSYVKYDDESQNLQQAFKRKFEELESMVNTHLTKAGRPAALVLTSLEESYMWVGKAVRDLQVSRVGECKEQIERGEE